MKHLLITVTLAVFLTSCSIEVSNGLWHANVSAAHLAYIKKEQKLEGMELKTVIFAFAPSDETKKSEETDNKEEK